MSIIEYIVQTKDGGWYRLHYKKPLIREGIFTRIMPIFAIDMKQMGNIYDIDGFQDGRQKLKTDALSPKQLNGFCIRISGLKKPTAPIIKVFEQIE